MQRGFYISLTADEILFLKDIARFHHRSLRQELESGIGWYLVTCGYRGTEEDFSQTKRPSPPSPHRIW